MHTMLPRLAISALLAVSMIGTAVAQDDPKLPDLGSSAGALISPAEASQYGASMLHQMRALHKVVDDPLLDEYINSVGYRLVAASPDPKQKFTFFIVDDNDINAFAAPGGYIGVNAGLIDIADSESELAAVMGHEIGHIAQHHLERAFEQSKKDAPLMALVLLGAIAAGAGQHSGDAPGAVLLGGEGLLQQRQINFTRKDEEEADAVGIDILAKAGYNPNAMADFFQRMQNETGINSADAAPSYLQDHPVTGARIAEANARARRLTREQKTRQALDADVAKWSDSTAPIPYVKDPGALLAPDRKHGLDTFLLMRERSRVLSGDPTQLIGYYRKNLHDHADFNTPSNHYGYALALNLSGRSKAAVAQLGPLLDKHPDNLPLKLAMADAQMRLGHDQRALASYAAMSANAPDNHAIAVAYADALIRSGSKASARKAANLLRPLLDETDTPATYTTYGRASKRAGDPAEAAVAFANASYLSGRPYDAMEQLRRVLKKPNLTYYQRARVQASIAQLTPVLLELQKRHVKTPDNPDRSDRPGQDSSAAG